MEVILGLAGGIAAEALQFSGPTTVTRQFRSSGDGIQFRPHTLASSNALEKQKPGLSPVFVTAS